MTPYPALLPVYSHIEYPFDIVRASDVYVYDAAGREYIDFYGGHCVALVGHSNPQVAEAISKQASEFMFYSNLAPSPVRREGARKFVEYAANGCESVFFCNSGAEANENALKIAVKATRRPKICAFKGAFHGRTLLSLLATDNQAWHNIYQDFLGEVTQIGVNERADLSLIDENTAAVILEPIQSIGGVREFDAAYLAELREHTQKVGAFLIFDEVQTGVGRTGVPFVSGWCGVMPDLFTCAKGLASGFPIGAVGMTRAAAATIEPGDIAATFGGGPLAMAAMTSTLDYVIAYDLAGHALMIESYVREKFAISQVEGVRGKGCLLGLVLKTEAKPVKKALFERGIIAGLCSDPKVLHLLPPLTIQKKHVDVLFEALIDLLGAK